MYKNLLVTALLGAVIVISGFAGGQGEDAEELVGEARGVEESLGTHFADPPGYYNLPDYEDKTGTTISSFGQAPMLDGLVNSGDLPPVAERLPETPLVQTPWKEIGEYGGTLTWDEDRIDFDRHLRYYSEAELWYLPSPGLITSGDGPWVGEVMPGVIESWDLSDDGTTYTLSLREGHRWSDGEPVTTEDVRFCVEDVLLNSEITPTAPEWLRWGEPKDQVTTQIEYVDDHTFKVVFSEPYPTWHYTYRSAPTHSWPELLRPAHYLKQFHKDYASWDQLMPKMEEAGFELREDWGTYFQETVGGTASGGGFIGMGEYAIGYPTLASYVPVKVEDNGNWEFERNPYFFMVDPEGNQLPYIDKLRRKYVSDLEVINLDIISGNTDVAGIWLPMDDFPLYAENQERGDYKVANTTVSNIQYSILFFNMAHQDTAYREVFQSLKFRQAMSHALDREQYVEAVFYGFGEPAQLSPYPGTPYYPEDGQEAFAAYDPQKSEALLDEIGLVDADDDGWREFPNGDDFVIQIDVAPIGPATVPSCELAKRYWEEVGVRVNMKEIESSLWWDLHEANEIMVSSWWAHGAKPSDVWHLGFRMNTPQWRAWFTTGGAEGVEPLPWAKEMLEAQRTFETAASREEAIAAGKKMWTIQRDYIPIIGMVSGPRLPWIYGNDLGNLADDPLNLEYPAKTIMGAATQWYFKNPDRR